MKKFLALFLLILACRGPVDLEKPEVSEEILNEGETIRYTWNAQEYAEGYHIYINDTLKDTLSVTETLYELSTPIKKIQFVSFRGDNESYPKTFSYITSVINKEIYPLSANEQDTAKKAGLRIDTLGSIFLVDAVANPESCAFILDDINFDTLLTLTGPQGRQPPFSNTYHKVKDTTGAWSDFYLAPPPENHLDAVEFDTSRVYFLYFTQDTIWDDSTDFFAKLKVAEFIDSTGAYKIKIGIQKKYPGLRWLKR